MHNKEKYSDPLDAFWYAKIKARLRGLIEKRNGVVILTIRDGVCVKKEFTEGEYSADNLTEFTQ